MVGFICDSYETVVVSNSQQERRFRVVRIPGFSGTKYLFEIEVFSSEIGIWSRIYLSSRGFECFYPSYKGVGVAYNGRLYFLNVNGTLVYNPYHVDTSQQQCHSIDFPIRFASESKLLACLGVTCGCLRLSQSFCKLNGDEGVVVWELKDFDNETGTGTWHWMHKIGFGIPRQRHDMIPFVLSFHPSDKNIMYIQDADTFFSCNLVTRMLEKVSDYNISRPFPSHSCHGQRYLGQAFPIVLPWWPTLIPYCD